MSTTETLELKRTVDHLRHCVGSLRALYGDVPVVRRLANDVERLDIDSVDLDMLPQHPAAHEKFVRIQVPDTPYDASMWLDSDDEGLGGHRTEHDE